jgi:predicted  nucleic acid-binding Zn-ribbon protein
METIDFQFFFNTIAGIFTFFLGIVIKSFWERIKETEKACEELERHHEKDLKEARAQLNHLALSLPEKYVSKGDFDNLVKTVHHRFDRLEEKIDHLSERN